MQIIENSMNRIDRLFNILLLLQNKRIIRAQDLAAKFEISERTVYRDIAALSEMGVPIISQAGEGYSLVEGYYLPPLIFTPGEAKAAFLGVRMLIASGNLPEEGAKLLQKLTAALPQPLLQEVSRQADAIEFYIPPAKFDLADPLLQTLQQAIIEKRVLFIHYYSFSENHSSIRKIEPHGLTYGNGVWYVRAFCRLRQGIRAFRLDRIEKWQLLSEHFVPTSSATDSSPTYQQVQVRFSSTVARWVGERQHYACIEESSLKDGSLLVTYRLERLDEIANWLLGWGAAAEVLSPPELRQQILEEAQKLVRLLT